ncbi:MAG: DUF523 domain-containing protein [Lagierella massiliensis]|nr:DUF523 domain-containing protein [Lagierella massiliensis]
MKEKVLVSSCMLGLHTRYDGNSSKFNVYDALKDKYEIIPFCPEQASGLSTPRKPCEIKGDKVINIDGEDKTIYFLRGAKETLNLCNLFNIKKAFLKSKSPSCGKGQIYDGTFTGNLVKGNGIVVDFLEKNGIEVISI